MPQILLSKFHRCDWLLYTQAQIQVKMEKQDLDLLFHQTQSEVSLVKLELDSIKILR